MNEIRMIQIYQLYSFKNHPFHVETDQELHDLVLSRSLNDASFCILFDAVCICVA